jgi:hypothetical protein
MKFNYEKLNEAMSDNILIYDAEAPIGVFTARLIALMKTIARRNYKSKVKTIFVKEQWMNESHEIFIDFINFEIIPEDATTKYLEKVGTLAYGLGTVHEGEGSDIELVVAELENGQYCLGSF